MGKDLGKTTVKMQANLEALLCYALGVVTGVIFLVMEKENKFVRFHAMQSVITFGGIFVLQIVIVVIPIIGWIIVPLLGIVWVILWILLMIKAYQGEQFKLPVIGDIAEKHI